MKAWLDAAWLSARYLVSAPGRTAVMVVAVAVAVFLPSVTVVVGRVVDEALLSRAVSTPIVVGHKGDQFDLVMSALYFRGEVPEPLPYATVARLHETPGVRAVPLHTGHTAGGVPVVGTSLGYFDARGLRLSAGRMPAVLGEVVAGAEVLGVEPGDTLRSDQRNLYNLSGSYPLRLTVVGTLAPSGTPDDEALFADVKTAWVLDGLMHGHGAVQGADRLTQDGDDLVASPGIFLFTEITQDTLASFHAHGDASDWPLSAVLVFPEDARGHDRVLGDLEVDPVLHAVRPVQVVQVLLGVVLRVQQLLAGYLAMQGAAMAGLLGVVVALSLRLRRDEVTLLRRMGASRGTVARMVTCELAWVIGLGASVAALAVVAVATQVAGMVH